MIFELFKSIDSALFGMTDAHIDDIPRCRKAKRDEHPQSRCACVAVDAAECARIRGGGSVRTFRGLECDCPCHKEFEREDDDF